MNNIPYHLLFLLFLSPLIFNASTERVIVSRPIKSTYNQYGMISTFTLQWKSYHSIYENNMIKVTFPQPIHGTSTFIDFCIATSHSVEIIYSQQSLTYVSDNIYYLPVSATLDAEVWYELTLKVKQIPVIEYGLVRMQIVSIDENSLSIGQSGVPFSWNNGFEYYHIEQNAVPITVNLSMQIISPIDTSPAIRQPLMIQFTSLVDVNQSVDIYIDFYDLTINVSDINNTIDNVGADNGFIFVGTCFTTCAFDTTHTCIHHQQCKIVDSTQIILTLPYLHFNETYLLQTTIINPNYITQAGLEMYWKQNNGQTAIIAFADELLAVHPININPQQINLLWGIPYEQVVNQMELGLFVNDPATTTKTLSSFDIGFSVDDISPIQDTYEVRVTVGATSILQQSINHNLPSFKSTTNINCFYQMPDLVCRGVEAFVKKDWRYYIRARGYFTTTDDLSKFGDVSIINEVGIKDLFTSLTRNLVVHTVTNSDYHDYSGLHNANNKFRIQDTLISSHNDTLLANSTATSINDFFRNQHSIVGVDPSISPQQLQFFLNVNLDQMSLASSTSYNQIFTMKIFVNPNVFNSSDRGIDFQTYSSSKDTWDKQSVPCYQDTSPTFTTQDYRCQVFDDYVHNGQFDNTFSKNDEYGVYQWVCGDGIKVTCPSLDCAEDCRILRGGFTNTSAMTDGSGGVLSIRNVSFAKNYQSPVQANEYNFDFIFAFYQDDTFVSASLVNGYTINQKRLKNIKAEVINKYLDDNEVFNTGDRIPTLLKLSGHFGFDQISTTPTSIAVYMPSSLTTAHFQQQQNALGCSTGQCYSYIGGLQKAYDNWVQQESVHISALPSLNEDFTILIPVQYTISQPIFSLTIKLVSSNNSVLGIYRLNGSALQNQYLFDTDANTPNADAVTYPSLQTSTYWSSDLANWVHQSTYVYEQAIDLSKIQPFQPSNTIRMKQSSLPIDDVSPSSTFTSVYYNIFSMYSDPTVDRRPCVHPFSYSFGGAYEIYVLWCGLVSGAPNQITFKYPLYASEMGEGFPFSLSFAYGYSNSDGNMIGYRLEDEEGGTAANCSTLKKNVYERDANSVQQLQIETYFTPFTLIPVIKNAFKIQFIPPIQLPMVVRTCQAFQPSLNIELTCDILTPTQPFTNIQMEIKYTGVQSVKIYSLNMVLRVIKHGTSTLSNTKQYEINVYLPFTHSTLPIPSMVGTRYSPYNSLISHCNNSFSFSTFYSQEDIQIIDPTLTSISKTFDSSLAFNAKFSGSRSTFFSSSSLQIQFNQSILTSRSMCTFYPDYHYWHSFTINSPANDIMILSTNRRIQDFCDYVYLVNCTNIITDGNNIQVTIKWYDYTDLISSSPPQIALHDGIPTTVSPGTGVLVKKKFRTAGFLGEYQFNLSLPASGSQQKLQIYVSVPQSNIHTLFLQCSYLDTVSSQWKYTMCYTEQMYSNEQVYMTIMPSTTRQTYLNIRVYGVAQGYKSADTSVTIIAKKTTDIISQTSSTTQYYKYTIVDPAPDVVTTKPIEIKDFRIVPTYTLFAIGSAMTNIGSYTLTIQYTLPIQVTGSIYLQVDELFQIQNPSQMFACTLNTSIIMNCSRAHPNILTISPIGTVIQSNLQTQTLTIQGFYLSNQQGYDGEQVHFGLFIYNPTSNLILHGDHQHLQSPLLTSDLLIQENLIWQISSNQFKSRCQVVYIGYYGLPAKLKSSQSYPLSQSFQFSIINNSNATIFTDLAVQLGTIQQQLYAAVADPTSSDFSLSWKNLQFAQNSLNYPYIPSLPICFSTQKCSLLTQFDQYNIFSGGITIPIAINFTSCKPIHPLTIQASVNTPLISVDSTLSTNHVDTNSEMAYIVLRHDYNNSTIGQSFSLSIQLTSQNAVTEAGYNQIPDVVIHVIDRGQLIGNPEGKQPQVNQLSSNHVKLTVECNSPATIYWGIGIYPTMLGITYQQIEARLIEKNNGLVETNKDIYSWSEELYGLDYTHDFNVQKQVVINSLKGGIDYVYKYYCVDQTGTTSGGKITHLSTPASNYSLVKVTVGFEDRLSYLQTDMLACAISESIVVPYNQTITSTGTNCINQSQVYYTLHELITDELVTNYQGKQLNHYFFYVDSRRLASSSIVQTLIKSLGLHSIFTNASIPYYDDLRVDLIANVYQPIIKSYSYTVTKNSFTLNIEVGLANTYLIAAIMSMHYDNQTMSIPTHYLMKQGYFSQGTKFQQIYSLYGRQWISAKFDNLTSGKEYSVFYFTTVDNSALNSQHSLVSYIDFTTKQVQLVDLFASNLTLCLCMITLLFWMNL